MIRFYEMDHEFPALPLRENNNCQPTKITVVDAGTFEAAAVFPTKTTCCLNFASHKRPGGGYGAVKDICGPIGTQEEDLFRRSNLPTIMDTPRIKGFYPLRGTEGFFTEGVIVDKDCFLQPLASSFETTVITVPAVVNPKGYVLVLEKLERILNIAVDNEQKTLILGAWGCGVFHNDPVRIASMFRDFLTIEFRGLFETVVFAVPDVNSHNHQVFARIL